MPYPYVFVHIYVLCGCHAQELGKKTDTFIQA
jgi:hypothetical protein